MGLVLPVLPVAAVEADRVVNMYNESQSEKIVWKRKSRVLYAKCV